MSAPLRLIRPNEAPPTATDEAAHEEQLRLHEAMIAARRSSDMVPAGAVLTSIAEDLREVQVSSPRRSSRARSEAGQLAASSSSSSCPACDDQGKYLTTAELATRLRLIPIDRYGDSVLAFCDQCAAGRTAASRWNRLPGEAEGISLAGLAVFEEQDEAVAAVEMFVERPIGWITFAGGYGVGKTSLIYAALNDLRARGIYGQYWTMPELLAYVREAIGNGQRETAQARLQRMAQLPVLAIDELDKYNATDWADEQVQQLFDGRYRERRQVGTLIGYNLAGAERIPKFVHSRIRDGRFKYIEMRGGDLRPAMEAEVGNDPHAVWDRGEDPAICERGGA